MKRYLKYALSLIFVSSMIITNIGCASGNHDNLKERLDSLLSANYLPDSPGAALLIAKDGKVIYDNGIGVADMNTHAKINGNTAFNIASISKQFTAVGALKLCENGKISLDDSVNKYFPEFKSDIWKSVKLKHLLSHCSGVPDARPRTNRDFMLHATDLQSIEYMHDLDSLKFVPGTYYDYINPTFDLFYVIFTKCTGKSFEQYQQENIFSVAGMNHTCYFAAGKLIENMAHGYVINEDAILSGTDSDYAKSRTKSSHDYVDTNGTHWAECDYGEETFFATKADGGIYTTTHDFLKWENALATESIISAKAISQAYKKHIKVSGSKYCTYQNRDNTWYGYGWFIDDTPGKELKIYHTGDNGGFQAYAAKYPESKVNVIMFENRNDIDRWTMQQKIELILREEGVLK